LFSFSATYQPYEYLDLLKPFRKLIVDHLTTIEHIPPAMREEADLRFQDTRIPKIRREILRLMADEINKNCPRLDLLLK
jgi:hypothetical protein